MKRVIIVLVLLSLLLAGCVQGNNVSYTQNEEQDIESINSAPEEVTTNCDIDYASGNDAFSEKNLSLLTSAPSNTYLFTEENIKWECTIEDIALESSESWIAEIGRSYQYDIYVGDELMVTLEPDGYRYDINIPKLMYYDITGDGVKDIIIKEGHVVGGGTTKIYGYDVKNQNKLEIVDESGTLFDWQVQEAMNYSDARLKELCSDSDIKINAWLSGEQYIVDDSIFYYGGIYDYIDRIGEIIVELKYDSSTLKFVPVDLVYDLNDEESEAFNEMRDYIDVHSYNDFGAYNLIEENRKWEGTDENLQWIIEYQSKNENEEHYYYDFYMNNEFLVRFEASDNRYHPESPWIYYADITGDGVKDIVVKEGYSTGGGPSIMYGYDVKNRETISIFDENGLLYDWQFDEVSAIINDEYNSCFSLEESKKTVCPFAGQYIDNDGLLYYLGGIYEDGKLTGKILVNLLYNKQDEKFHPADVFVSIIS